MGYRIDRLRDFASALRESKELLAREHAPRAELERHQRERLRELARHARAHAPLWRERIPAGDFELSDLPALTKQELMENFDGLVADQRLKLDALLSHLDRLEGDEAYLGVYRAMTSSGSSGRKGVFVYDRAGCVGLVAMFLRRSEWLGTGPRLPRLRVALVSGAAPTHMSARGARRLDVGVHRLLRLSVTQPLDELVASLNDFQPQHMSGYPSIIAPLAEEQVAGRLRIRPESVNTSSEPLSAATRERIEAAFGIRPTNFYASTEGLWGHECPEGSMHMFDDMCIVENVDDDHRPVPAGEAGSRVLVTNLFNRVQPLIRLEVTDLMAVDPEPCPCGRSLIRMRSVDGRAEEVLELGGVTVHPLQFAVVTSDPDVREFQVVQQGDSLRLRVALRDGADGAPARLRERVGARLEELGVPRPAVEVETVDALERSPAGKLQVVVADRGR